MNTSSYNHNAIGTQGKPLIENREFKDLCRNADDIMNVLESKSLEAFQKQLFTDKINKIKDLLK